MTVKPFIYEMVFRANTTAASSAADELRRKVANVTSASDGSSAAIGKHSTTLDKDAAASKRAAKALDELTLAEKRARDQMLRGTGTGGVPLPVRQPILLPPEPAPAPSSDPKQLDDLRAQYVPLYAAQRAYQRNVDDLSKAEKLGALSTEEYTGAQNNLRLAYDRNVEGIKRVDPALRSAKETMKLSSHEAKNLSYQLNDIFQTLALGMPISQIAMQQGPQITQIYGGIGNTLKAVKAALTPVRLAFGATAAVAITGAIAYNSYLKSTKAVEVASLGLGRAQAGTAADMEAAARAGAAAAGISISSARAMEVAFLRTGSIGSDNFDELIGMSKDFAATIGISADQAGGALAEMFANPAKAADVLYRKYGLIDAATARHATNLAAQNRVSEAQAVILDALPDRLVDATDATTALGRAWDFVKTKASDAGDVIGGAINAIIEPTNADARINELRAELSGRDRADGNSTLIGHTAGRRLREKEARSDNQKELDRLLAERNGNARIAMAESLRAQAAQKGRVALGLAEKSPVNDNALLEEKLRNRLAALQAGQNAPDQDAEQQRRVAAAIGATAHALAGLINRRERAVELDALNVQISTARNPLIRAELEARSARLSLADKEIAASEIEIEVARARNRVMNETISAAAAQGADLRADARARRIVNEALAKGAITSEDANRALQEELTLRPLIAAAALAEGDEKTRLIDVIRDLQRGYADLASEQKRASGLEFLRTQSETLEKLQIEAVLLGQNAATRARLLALHRAELEIRRRGIDADGGQARDMRSNAVQIANNTRELEKQATAWGKVQSAAEGAIDTTIDGLLSGDLSDVVDDLARDITGMFSELAIKNPLKNAILGTDYGTLDDLDGLKGIWAKLTGNGGADTALSSLGSQVYSVSNMSVTAASIIISGGGGAGALLGSGGSGKLGGSGTVQQQIWDFFKGKGLKSHQIAGIMGNVSAESSFNPFANGDGGDAYGLFQHNNRAPALLNHIGGAGNLGNVQGQLEFVWKELLTSERASLERLLSSTDVRGATGAFTGFERPRGWSLNNPEGAEAWGRRLSSAEAALTKFGATTSSATQNLGELGGGFDAFGQFLAKIGNGSGAGSDIGGGTGEGGFWGALIQGIGQFFGQSGFMTGGATGGSDPARVAGLVHEREYVFDAVATSRIGVPTLEAMRKGTLRGFRSGGFAMAGPTTSTANRPWEPMVFSPKIIIENNSSANVEGEIEETVSPSGERSTKLVLADAVGRAMTTPGGGAKSVLGKKYGLRQRRALR